MLNNPEDHEPTFQERFNANLRKMDHVRVSYRGWSIQSGGYDFIIIVAIAAIVYLAKSSAPYIWPGAFICLLASIAHPRIRLNGKNDEKTECGRSGEGP